MPLKKYGVLKGHVTDYTLPDENDRTPHLHVKIKADNNELQVIINVLSQEHPSEILYYAGEEFHSDQITHLPGLEYGFTKIDDNNSDIALDYIRGNLLDKCKMVPLPVTARGENNDLSEKLVHYISKAKNNQNVDIYAYGEKIPPGIHDVHMNQGNVERFKRDDGIWQDGGLLMNFKDTDKWVAIFLAFQSQSWCTDDKGHATKPVEECNHRTGC